jgi:3-oxoacyl-[acyl-carrier protein] reductase
MALLTNKVALVTGAAAGIGESVARLFASEGALLYLLDIDSAGVARTAAATGGEAFTADVRRREQVAAAADAAIRRHGRIDILVNNAGVYPRQGFLEMTEEQWDTIQDINLKSVFHCTQLVMPHMVAARSGKVVNVSSVTFLAGYKNLTHYVASKGGIIGFSRALAREVGEHNVHVNCVTPGSIQVEAEKAVSTPAQIAGAVASQCLNRRLQPIDVARVCLFLASELSDGVTGQIVNVDGGRVMW